MTREAMMKRGPTLAFAAVAVVGVALAWSSAAAAETNVRVGWCAKTVTSAGAPFAIATKLGWYADAGIKVELVPLPGSTDSGPRE